MSQKGFSRREFLRAGALSTAALGTGAIGGRKAQTKSNFGDAKNVIFLVSDGMSAGTLGLADLVKQAQYGEKTHWMKLYESDRDYHRGLMDMASELGCNRLGIGGIIVGFRPQNQQQYGKLGAK